jgi:amino acid transporter
MADFERDRRAAHEIGSVPVGSDRAGDGPQGSVPLEERSTLREEVVGREREEFGGIKFGSAFFGWLAATGTAVILTALVAATGAAIGLGVTDNGQASLDEGEATTIGIVGAIALVVVLLISYFCGGYVAGRMARFDGLKQGLAVWLWAVVIAVVVAVIGAIAGSQFNILANLNSFPRIPINEGAVTTGGIITAVVLALASLIGALLGGVAGMRFHRKVDRAGLGR